ncbi:MAG: polysaccharide biosynthesis/export family protein [Armatimonadota bacterium]|nr:polysaccharide biosynthesis/export family protein [Armatimonadota bacterium]
MVKKFSAVLLSLIFLSSWSPAGAQSPYLLGPDDVLEITVYGYADLSRLVTVLPDGTISVPLVGIITVAGLTVEQATKKIAQGLALYIKNPQVVVIVKEFRKFRIAVLGQVMRPGTYELKPGVTVLDALSAAGGLTEKASVTQARLIRASGETVPLRLDELLLRQEMRHNLPLQSGDTLMIPEELNNKIFVLGDVNAPGVFVIREDITILQALALAGGPAQRGYGTARAVHIVRRAAAPPKVPKGVTVERMEGRGYLITVDLQSLMRNGAAAHDLTVTAGDIIVVPQSGLTGMQSILSILAGITGLFR